MQLILQEDNRNILRHVKPGTADLVYADMIYDNFDFSWVEGCLAALSETGSLFIQTDYRSVAELKVYIDELFGWGELTGYLNNWIIWPYDWGGRPRNAFGRKHDDILWYVKNKEFKFYPNRVAIPKVTAGSPGLNPSGRTYKIPTDVWSDIGNFLTTSPERVRDEEGVGIPHQKPERLIERIVRATTDIDDLVVDPFMGTGTTGVVCKKWRRRFVGFEIDPEMLEIAADRIRTARKEIKQKQKPV